MRKFLCVSFLLLSISAFSQGEAKIEIQWSRIEKAQELAKKYDSDMLVFFFRKGCPECKQMKAETLQNPEIIKLINENFFPVMLNARTKDTLIYNGKQYVNQQPKKDGETWRHDLYHELVVDGKHQYVYPYIVIINGEHQNIKYLPGFFPAIRLKRSLQKLIK
jgi:thioredoxin-related protein